MPADSSIKAVRCTPLDASKRNGMRVIGLLCLLALAAIAISLFIGRYPVPVATVCKVCLAKILPITSNWPATIDTLILQIRLPRALLAFIVGAGLSISGAAYQGMFRNPLVSPDILGASAAAGFGAALALLLDFNSAGVQTTAFLFSLLGVLLTYLISRVHKTTPVMMMVLSGIVVGSFFGGLLSITKYIADPDEKLPLIVFWLMGSLSKATMKQFLNVLPSMLIGMLGLLAISWRINILAMGDKEARSLGVRTELLKGIIVICATLITASAVSVSGIIGWVGLVIPHAVRMLVGSNNRILLPATLFVGGIFLLSIDIVARSVTTAEIPLGIITSLIGAPFFALLLRQRKKELP